MWVQVLAGGQWQQGQLIESLTLKSSRPLFELRSVIIPIYR